MPDLLTRLKGFLPYDGLLKAVRAGERVIAAEGAAGAARGLLVSALAAELDRPVVAVAPDLEAARGLADEVESLLPPGTVRLLPDRDLAPYEPGPVSPQIAGLRLEALPRLPDLVAGVVVTTAVGWLEALMPPARLGAFQMELTLADTVDREAILHRLVTAGYRRVDVVELAGEFSARGWIVDLFSPAAGRPIRLELDGETLASLRWFDPATQRSLEEVERVWVGPAAEALLTADERMAILARLPDPLARRGGQRVARLRERLETGMALDGEERFIPWLIPGAVRLAAYLPRSAVIVMAEPGGVREAWERAVTRAAAMHEELARAREPVPGAGELYADPAAVRQALADWPQVRMAQFAAADAVTTFRFGVRPVRFGAQEWEALRRSLAGWAAAGAGTWIAGESGEEREAATGRAGTQAVVLEGRWTGGAELAGAGIVLMPARDVLGAPVHRIPVRRPPKAFRDAFADLKPGDPVVHEEYGIGLYQGVLPLSVEGVRQDFFLLEYAESQKLYLPADQAHRVQRYLGAGRHPKLDRLGTGAWERTKAKVAAALRLYAGELLKHYAERAVASARPFPSTADVEAEFARTFPYEETPDQARVIVEVGRDLEGAKVMDRVVCGDVGYGKTEVLIRAAFRVAVQGSQVAVLVPTTILAQQHFQNLTARMAGTPVTVGMLSRFRTPEERARTVAGLANGSVDIVIGTHHLLSASIVYRNLGLLVVDEEHRFGVRQKEKIKELKKNVHVLTLTATPIPRTLNMGMAGLRDLSVIETPPPGRLAIVTHVHEENPAVAREAILRELARGGQVFYLHNRVQSIMVCARKIQEMVPKARVVVAHGQMPLGPLEKAMGAFSAGRADILVSTSIIGAGLDLPNANTLIIERAENFGLADLYQLRGRVGRGSRQAYAYFFFSPKGVPTLDARRRLAAMIEFGELGSGFRLAVRDLEIRGAGNLLGAEQHGALHAVGFDLYSRMLDSAVREMKGEVVVVEVPPPVTLGVEAYLPEGYVPDGRSKLEVYKRLAACAEAGELGALTAELRDRFGEPPIPVSRLVALAGLRVLGVRRGLVRATRHGAKVRLEFRDREALRAVIAGAGGGRRGWVAEDRALTVTVPPDPDEILRDMRAVLEGAAGAAAVPA